MLTVLQYGCFDPEGSVALQGDTVTQADSMLSEFPASPLSRSLRFLEAPDTQVLRVHKPGNHKSEK
jgi:hypothetical protein